MYYIDSLAQTVTSFTFDPEEGTIADSQILIDFGREKGIPDGMTVDEEGMLWVTQWEGWQVSRWNPRTGRCLETIRVPAAKVTSCCFGGDHLDMLYITTARMGLEASELAAQPNAGGIFAVKTKVKGLPSVPF